MNTDVLKGIYIGMGLVGAAIVYQRFSDKWREMQNNIATVERRSRPTKTDWEPKPMPVRVVND